MFRAVIPSTDLMTHRDLLLEEVYSNASLLPELKAVRDKLQAVSQRHSLIHMESAWRKQGRVPLSPFETTEEDELDLPSLENEIDDLRSREEELETDQYIHLSRVNYVVGKREGFLAGIKYAACVINQSPDEMIKLLCALADEACADKLLYDITKHMPAPDTSVATYFNPPTSTLEASQPALEAAPAQQEGGEE